MNAFQRLLPGRVWWQGSGLAVVVWSVCGVIVAATALLLLTLLIDLLVYRGGVDLLGEDLKLFTEGPQAVKIEGAPADIADEGSYELHDQGLLATGIRYRNKFFHGWLVRATGVPSPLRDNDAAAVILVLCLAVVGLARSICASRARMAAARLAARTMAHLRQSVHRQTVRLATSELDGKVEREAVELFTREIDRIGGAVTVWVARLPGDVCLFVALCGLALWADVRLTVQCLVPAAAAWWIAAYERTRSQQIQALAQGKAESDLRLLADGLRRSRLVCGYGMESFEREQFQKHLDRYTRDMTAGRLREAWAIWASRAAGVLCLALVVFFISARVLAHADPLPLPLGALLLIALARMGWIVHHARELVAARQAILVGGDKVLRFVNAIPEVGQAVGAKFLEPVSKSIIYEAVSYRLDGRALLKDFDLRIAARTSVALVSLDRAACRAAAFLLPRFIEPQSGRVLFDSEDTAWATLDSLRAETILVSGDDRPFTGSVLQNITCGDSRYSMQDATDAAKISHAHNFIARLPQGYETALGEHGERVDAGQAFRLALARAILRKPAVLIIEEPEEALDEDTKNLLDDAYHRIIKDRTVIFLPTRLSTVRRCEQVVLIQDGRVAAAGTHDALVKQSETYRHWEYVTFNPARQAGKA
jgi:ABC-type multidrug transport system fused ATPase/permease subunit